MALFTNGYAPEKPITVAPDTTNFVRVKNPSELEDELRSRLPLSAMVLNAVKLHQKWGDDIQCYSYGWENPKEAWIAVKYIRPDYNQEIVISRPPGVHISLEMKERLKNASFIDWNDSFMFCAVDEQVMKVLADISIMHYENRTAIHPNYLFYMDVEEAEKLQPELKGSEKGEIISLTTGTGTDFLYKTWKYSIPASRGHMDKCLQLNPSAGVAVNGEIVCGVTLTTHGLIGMLATVPEARCKGYAKASMHSIMKQLGDEGFIPACVVEVRNLKSMALQHRLGFKQGPKVYFLPFNHDYK